MKGCPANAAPHSAISSPSASVHSLSKLTSQVPVRPQPTGPAQACAPRLCASLASRWQGWPLRCAQAACSRVHRRWPAFLRLTCWGRFLRSPTPLLLIGSTQFPAPCLSTACIAAARGVRLCSPHLALWLVAEGVRRAVASLWLPTLASPLLIHPASSPMAGAACMLRRWCLHATTSTASRLHPRRLLRRRLSSSRSARHGAAT